MTKELMQTFQEKIPEAAVDEWWALMEPVYELQHAGYKFQKDDKLLKSPKLRHTCEGRHPELFENTGFPPSRE